MASTTPAPDLTEIEELLVTMKQTLGALSVTFDTLGEQTARIAVLGPAMDTAHQVSAVQKFRLLVSSFVTIAFRFIVYADNYWPKTVSMKSV